MKSVDSDIFKNIEVFRACISSFVPLIEWSFRMITHSLSGGGKGMTENNALDCAMISICWCPPGTVQRALQNLKVGQERGVLSAPFYAFHWA
jgi:hypothetical protein